MFYRNKSIIIIIIIIIYDVPANRLKRFGTARSREHTRTYEILC